MMWPLAKVLLYIILAALGVGLMVGIFTYGKRQSLRRHKDDGLVADVLSIGVELSHLMIDWILGRFGHKRKTTGEWLSDREMITRLRKMHPNEFEGFVAKLFQALGYTTEVVGGAGDGGVDVEAEKNGKKHYIQCKKYITSSVSVGDVRDFCGGLLDYLADSKGIFITTGTFTTEAEQFVEGKPIELIDQSELVKLVRDSGIEVPQSDNAVPVGRRCPRCGGTLVERKGKRGPFIGCSRFPQCRYTDDL